MVPAGGLSVHWFQWLLIGLWVIGTVFAIIGIDEPRDPRTRGEAVASLIINGAFIWALIHYWGK